MPRVLLASIPFSNDQATTTNRATITRATTAAILSTPPDLCPAPAPPAPTDTPWSAVTRATPSPSSSAPSSPQSSPPPPKSQAALAHAMHRIAVLNSQTYRRCLEGLAIAKLARPALVVPLASLTRAHSSPALLPPPSPRAASSHCSTPSSSGRCPPSSPALSSSSSHQGCPVCPCGASESDACAH